MPKIADILKTASFLVYFNRFISDKFPERPLLDIKTFLFGHILLRLSVTPETFCVVIYVAPHNFIVSFSDLLYK